MTQNFINIGILPNDGAGDPLRTAFDKINNNFTQLFKTSYTTSNAYSTGNVAGQVIFEAPVDTFTQGIFQINSNDTLTNDTENITLTVSVAKDGSGLQWSGHSTLFFGNVLTSYDVDIVDSTVRILVNPLVDTEIFHFTSAQITWKEIPAPMATALSSNMQSSNKVTSLIENQRPAISLPIMNIPTNNIIEIENEFEPPPDQLTIYVGVLVDDAK